MLFLITTSVYKDYQHETHLQKIEEESKRILEDNISKASDYSYFLSEQYKDKYAKQTLGKINPGERVIVFTAREENIYFEKREEEEFRRTLINLPRTEQWFYYYFGDKSIENIYAG